MELTHDGSSFCIDRKKAPLILNFLNYLAQFRYQEVCNPGYNFGSESPSNEAGHFTQVVWKKSTKVGMGKATKKKNGGLCTYIVARYKPAGNFAGKYKENVEEGTFERGMCEKLDSIVGGGGDGAGGDEAGNPPDDAGGTSVDDAAGGNGNFIDSADSLLGPGGSQGVAASPGRKNFEQLGLQAHNIFRKIHGTPPLKLNAKMSKEAADYAKVIANLGSLKHSESTDDGENLAYACSSDGKGASAQEITKNW